MQLNQYINYFKALAETHSSILHDDNDATKKHFGVVSIFELTQNLQGFSPGTCMLLELPSSNINEQNSDNRLDLKTGAFSIVVQQTKAMDNAAIYTAMDECEAIARQIIARIKYLSRNSLPHSIKELPLDRVEFMFIQPNVYAGYIGARCQFDFKASEPNNYHNPDLWP